MSTWSMVYFGIFFSVFSFLIVMLSFDFDKKYVQSEECFETYTYTFGAILVGVRDQFCSGAEVSCLNNLSSACTKIKWVCPNITRCFARKCKMAFWNNSRGEDSTRGCRSPPPPPRIVLSYGPVYIIIFCSNDNHLFINLFTMLLGWTIWNAN